MPQNSCIFPKNKKKPIRTKNRNSIEIIQTSFLYSVFCKTIPWVFIKCLAAAISSTVTTHGWDSSFPVDLTLATFCPTDRYNTVIDKQGIELRIDGSGQLILLNLPMLRQKSATLSNFYLSVWSNEIVKYNFNKGNINYAAIQKVRNNSLFYIFNSEI